MYFAPATVGEDLTLRCLSWDGEKASRVVFYKNNVIMLESTRTTHRMLSVAEADQGAYRCHATVENQIRVSEAQKLFIHGLSTLPPKKWYQSLFHHVDHCLCSISVGGMRPKVSGIFEVSCSCPECPTESHYIWYKMDQDSRPLKLPGNSQASMKPDRKGTYACVALWDSGRTLISKGHFCE